MKTLQSCDEGGADDAARPRWPIRVRTWMLCGTLAFGMAGCEFGCDSVLRYSVDPTVKTLRVGEAFSPNATVRGGCGKILAEAWSWTTTDSIEVRVVSTTGRAIGVTPGTAKLRGAGKEHSVSVEVAVTVVP